MPLEQLITSIQVSSITAYIEQQSDVDKNQFVFSYQITITNNSQFPVQLLSRHWLIQDANLKMEEIFGDGVIGKQPVIEPGQNFSYNSGAILETEVGTMEGRYFFVTTPNARFEDIELPSKKFEILIPKFTLSIPRTLH